MYFDSFYTALVLHELINECPLSDAAAKYNLTKGTVQSLQQTASTFAGIVKSFCKALNWDLLALIVSQFQDRIFFGVHQDLIELMKISVLNGQRARALFHAGFRTLVDISKANVLSIEKILVDSISFDVQKRDGETNYDAEQRNKQRLLFVTGRAGLSVKEAAQLIIDEARHYLRTEIGIQNINWNQENETATENPKPEKIISIESQQVLSEVHIKPALVDDRQPTLKRKISLDKEVATPHKRPNREQAKKEKDSSTSELSSENSDVDSINLDNSNSFYNDENEDFMQQLQHSNNGPIISNDQYSTISRLKIIDVTQNAEQFDELVKSFRNIKECGFAIAIAKPDPLNRLKNYRCSITSDLYVYGVAMCFQENYVAHFLSLQDDEGTIEFKTRIEFINNILTKNKLTLQINDAKSQLNALLKAIPGVQQLSCQIEDSQVAQWLIQPDEIRSFSKLVWKSLKMCVFNEIFN